MCRDLKFEWRKFYLITDDMGGVNLKCAVAKCNDSMRILWLIIGECLCRIAEC